MNMILNMTTPAPTGSNIGAVLEPYLKELEKLGNMEAAGGGSRIRACELLVSLSFDGLIGEKDAQSMYDRYKAGVPKLIAKGLPTVDGANQKQQVSKFRTCIKLGGLPTVDGPELAKITREVTEALRGAEVKTKPPVDALLDVARKQLAEPTVQLTREQIENIVRKPEPRTKEQSDGLIDAYKAAVKAYEVFKDEDTEEAVHRLKAAIVKNGGELPPLTKEAKAQAALMKRAAAMGFVIAPPH